MLQEARRDTEERLRNHAVDDILSRTDSTTSEQSALQSDDLIMYSGRQVRGSGRDEYE